MIKKLRRRFILLAMTALTVLLAVIVAGMNIVNYEKVVSDADTRLEVLEQNSDFFLMKPDIPDYSEEDGNVPDGPGKFKGDDEKFFGRGGAGGPSMSRDEAEESRFFTVTLDENDDIQEINTDRIYAVDDEEVYEYTNKVLKSGRDEGFVDEFRYDITEENGVTVITFLDCGRVLASFRNFLRYSIIMSLIGLAIMFVVIYYFSGRIVKPVAESYEKQKRFITDAGHEIKTPLAIIKANIDLMDMELEGDAKKEELKESLSDINDQVDRLTGLTNDLVYLSRMEEADGSLVMTETPLSDIVSETVSSFEPLAAEKGKSIVKDITPMISVQGSSKELEKLVSILMENAIKYSREPRRVELRDGEDGMPAPPEIRAELYKEGKNAVLRIANDTDTEMTNEALSHVFERFYRTDGSRNSQTGGHGIGLSMASAIVAAHSGSISARTTDGHDFIVTALIPLS